MTGVHKIIGLLAVLALFSFSTVFAEGGKEKSINFLGWYDECVPAVIAAFEAEYNIKVNYKNFEANEEAFNILKTDPEAWDIISGDGYWPVRYYEEGLTQEFDPTEYPIWKEYYPEFRRFASEVWKGKKPGTIVAFPVTWGMYQLTTLTTKIPKKLSSWADVWDPQFKGRLLIPGQGNEILALTALSMGTPLNQVYDLTPEQLAPVTRKAIDLKSNIRTIYANVEEIGNLMKQEDVWIAFTWSNNIALNLRKEGIPAEAYVPGGKTVGWISNIMVSAKTKKKDAALSFVNFIMSRDMRLVRWTTSTKWDHLSETNQAFANLLREKGFGDDVDVLNMDHPEQIREMQLFVAPKYLDAYVDAWAEWMTAN